MGFDLRRGISRIAERTKSGLPIPGRKVGGRRSLLGDFLFMQLGFATLVGALATAGLWYTTNFVTEENLEKWAEQWVDRLDTLGSPLYVTMNDQEFERIREYVESFEEIAFVRYYQPDGTILFEENVHGQSVPPLTTTELARLDHDTRGHERVHMDDAVHAGQLFRASKSLWAESIVADGLIGFDPDVGGEEEKTLLGFVEIGLDFDHYRTAVTRRVVQWSFGILVALFCIATLGLLGFWRALRPLRNLTEPLSQLAEGKLDVPFHDGGHAELAAINEALATTINALHERDQKLRQAANFDPLTGLAGRVGLNDQITEQIEAARNTGEHSALLFVDLDQFKHVNDTVGHAAGDRLLIRVAEVFRSIAKDDDLICRYGGDEFVLLRRGADRVEAEFLASTIVESMRQIQFVEDGRAFNVRCSIGVAMIDAHSVSCEEIMAQADMACHEAKGQGRNRFQVFVADSGERTKAAEDMGWSERIREAIENDGFSLRYQPIVQIGSEEASLYEVLLRMRGRGPKVIPPGAFLPAADRFGLMGDLDYWVIRNALEKLAKVREARPDVVFALNLSGIVFSDFRLVEFVSEQLEKFELPGAAVVFEITEQVAVRHVEEASKIMEALISMGCRFALDDFGAGFSSFNYLKQLPVSFIKIDGAFIENLVHDPADRAIVASITQIAQVIGTQTVAEHVRDQETLELLAAIGVDYAQGYYLGKPRVEIQKAVELTPSGASGPTRPLQSVR